MGNYKNGNEEGNGNSIVKLFVKMESMKIIKMESEKEMEIISGKLEQIGNYKNGKQEGEWKFYHENGKLRKIENYKNGKRVSVQDF